MDIDYKAHNEDRIRRAKSWLARAEEYSHEDVEAFTAYWIAFNAAYGQLQNQEESDRRRFVGFSRQIVNIDTDETIKAVLDENFAAVKRLMKNKYIYEPFWWSVRHPDQPDWKTGFTKHNKQLLDGWSKGHVDRILHGILTRLYTIRNQIIHGGVTYGPDGWGKNQLESGRHIMSFLIPEIIDVMDTSIKNQPDTDVWGAVAYPRFER